MNSNSNGRRDESAAATKPAGVSCDVFLRLLAFVLTLAAAIAIGMGKQTKLVPLKLVDFLPPINVPVSAKWHYISTFDYFMVTNTIACTYGVISMILTLLNRGKNKVLLGTLITVLDALMVALLFSGVGGASAVGIIALKGNSFVRWDKVCNVFDKFCHIMITSIILSFLGSLSFLLLVVLLPLLRFHRRT